MTSMAIRGDAAAQASGLTILFLTVSLMCLEPNALVAGTIVAELAGGESRQPDKTDALDQICRAVERVSADNDLPVEFFIRLIWQESKFETRLVSRKGARGIAQFMPATAAERGLRNPFEPLQALKESGSYLRELSTTFGNLGLAAAAYNAGPGRVSHWLAGKARLPGETERYVEIVTGRPVGEWISSSPPKWEGVEIPKDVPCDELIALIAASREDAKMRAATFEQVNAAAGAPEPRPPIDNPSQSAAREPESWGVQLAGHWEEGHVLASFERIRRQFPEIIGEHQPLVLKQQSAMGHASRYVLRLVETSRQSAEALCDRLRAADGACLVLANPPEDNPAAQATAAR
jgi:hypothetical protein